MATYRALLIDEKLVGRRRAEHKLIRRALEGLRHTGVKHCARTAPTLRRLYTQTQTETERDVRHSIGDTLTAADTREWKTKRMK